MTNAILFNHQRGSGREVTVDLSDVGAVITKPDGESIAVWPFASITLRKETRQEGEGIFRVPFDEVHSLRIIDAALWKLVVTQSPEAAKALRATKPGLLGYVTMMPAQVQVALWLCTFFGVMAALRTAWDWLLAIWEGLFG